MKRFTCLLFSLIFCFSICFQGISVSAVSLGLKHKKTGKCGDNVYWNYDEKTKTVVLTGSGPMADYDYEGDESGIYATSEYDSNLWSRDCEKAIIAEGITSIGDLSFYQCNKLKSVVIPKTIKYIGEYAFAGCFILEKAELPEGLKTIRRAAFGGCYSLNKITIPSTVKKIGDDAFESKKLVEVCDLSKTGKDKFPYALHYYTDAQVKSRLTKINSFVFLNMDNKSYLVDYKGNKSKLVLPQGIQINNLTINKYEIAPYAFNGQDLKGKKPFESVTIPRAVTKIGDSAFFSCDKLSTLRLSEGLKEIGEWAFAFNYFYKVKLPESLIKIEKYAFSYCDRLIQIKIPRKVKFSAKDAFSYSYRLQEIRNLSKLPKSSFRKVPSYLSKKTQKSRVVLKNNCYFLVLNDKVKCVGSTNPKGKIVMPNSIRYNKKTYNKYSIEEYAFEKYENITSLKIPNAVSVIGRHAFYDNINLKKVTISKNVKKIGKDAFYECVKLKSIIIKGKNTVLYKDSVGYFYNNGKTSKVKGFIIYCVKNSKAMAYAKKNKICYKLLK